ncbi:Dot/Icm T4SS effector Zinc-dependent metalloprotease LegP [Aquipuribacter sp. SD81]|uniref:Dot/Icm T4SS effector Zinc-dependent metalloprotease LegP n=1 Tax=Aquipuribacter sp. SD81 TaxID=3127703 RepID=UPI0030180716
MAETPKGRSGSGRSRSGGSGTGRGGSSGDGSGDGSGEEFLEGGDPARRDGEVGTAYLDGVTFRSRPVQYVVVDGLAMLEGDITLGPVEEVEAITQIRRDELASPDTGAMVEAVLRSGAEFRWPQCRVPYEIDGGLPDQARVTDAIAHWEARTRFRFVRRTAANAAQFPDFVAFVPGTGCSSFVGRRGGRQEVRLAAGCTLGNTIHEIGHVVGLWHEQSREDRDAFVRVEWANIEPTALHNFDQHITDGDDSGAYDYGSIMHYPRNAFSRNGADTIVPLQAGVTIGQRTGLSAGDIAAANSMCPVVKPPVKELPKELVKERPKDLIKERPKEVVKEVVKERPKELVKEVVKELPKDRPKDLPKDLVNDPVKRFGFDPPFRVPGPVVQPVPPFRSGLQPGVQPFVLATGQDAGEAEPAQPDVAAAEALAQLQALVAHYARLDALGVLGPDDRAAWQQAATAAQQLLDEQG